MGAILATITELTQNRYRLADCSPKRGKDKFIRLQTVGILAYSVDEFCHLVGIGRSSFYQLMNSGALRTVFIRGRRLIPAVEVNRLLSGDDAASISVINDSQK